MATCGRSGDGEYHQTEPGEEYSTEKGGGSGGGGVLTHEVHAAALKNAKKHEVGSEECEQDFATMQMEDGKEYGQPGDQAK
jgi:hypothetical protein